MSVKAAGNHAESFLRDIEVLQKSLLEFDKVCMDENFTKLVDELKNRGQSTILNPQYLESLTTKTILRDVCFYNNLESSKYKYKCSSKQKLFFLYGLYHNYCWRIFDQLYNPMVERTYNEFCAGGTAYSQDPLMEKCLELIKQQKISQQKKFYTAILNDLEVIREKLHAHKEGIVYYSELLFENGASSSITRVVTDDRFNLRYFASVKMESNSEFRFKYRGGDIDKPEVYSPMEGAHMININNLRNIIDTIFKIPSKGRLKKNSNKGKLFRFLLKLIYF